MEKERTKMESAVYQAVSNVIGSWDNPTHDDRREIATTAIRILDKKHKINCARDDTKAGDYLGEALDFYLY